MVTKFILTLKIVSYLTFRYFLGKIIQEKEFLKKKAHQKSLDSVTQSLGRASKGSNPSGEHGKSARSKHNAKQRKLYQKRLKARK